MRMLADNPSMDFLRREAKELLAALRESDAATTLADAQRALAELYGLRTWAELKTEVEQRREDRPEAPAGLAEGIAAAFGLGAPQSPMTPIRYEYMGRRWCLDTERGRYMLSPVFDWIGDEQAEVAVELSTRARAEGVTSPVPVRTPEGGLVRRVLEQNWRVDEWMDLGPTPVRPVHSSVGRRAGSLLAAIHAAAVPTARPVEGPWITIRPSQASWATLFQRAEAAGAPWLDELAAMSRNVAELNDVTAAPRPGEAVISNCDLVPEAVRFGRGDELVVVHWDYAGPMIPEWELATVLVQWTLFAGLNVEAARALVDGYRDRAGDVPTLTLGSFHVAATGWLNWLHNQTCEALDPATPDKAEFSRRALRETLDDPLTVGRLTGLLDALAPVSS